MNKDIDKQQEEDLRKCFACYKMKPTEEFPVVANKIKGYCKICYGKHVHKTPEQIERDQKKANRRHNDTARSNRQQLVEEVLAKTPCVDCGLHDPVVMEFDHRDPADKIVGISKLIQSGTKLGLMTELAKCDVVCANCHRRRTAKTYGSWRTQIAKK